MLLKKNKKELTKDDMIRNNAFCQYRSKCTDFGVKCCRCQLNGLNETKSYFKGI